MQSGHAVKFCVLLLSIFSYQNTVQPRIKMKLRSSSDILTQVSVGTMPSINGTCSRITCDIRAWYLGSHRAQWLVCASTMLILYQQFSVRPFKVGKPALQPWVPPYLQSLSRVSVGGATDLYSLGSTPHSAFMLRLLGIYLSSVKPLTKQSP